MAGHRFLWILAAFALAGCSDQPAKDAEKPAIPSAVFEGLPLSGNLATAIAAGFGNCLDVSDGLRCRKDGVVVMGTVPLTAAVDFAPATNGAAARFDHVTLWHPTDQSAVLMLRDTLGAAGWQSCLTPDEERYWRPGSPIHIAVDASYWGKRRVVISAPPAGAARYC